MRAVLTRYMKWNKGCKEKLLGPKWLIFEGSSEIYGITWTFKRGLRGLTTKMNHIQWQDNPWRFGWSVLNARKKLSLDSFKQESTPKAQIHLTFFHSAESCSGLLSGLFLNNLSGTLDLCVVVPYWLKGWIKFVTEGGVDHWIGGWWGYMCMVTGSSCTLLIRRIEHRK